MPLSEQEPIFLVPKDAALMAGLSVRAIYAELRRRKRTGDIALLDAGKQPLWEFGEEWWRLYARPNPRLRRARRRRCRE